MIKLTELSPAEISIARSNARKGQIVQTSDAVIISRAQLSKSEREANEQLKDEMRKVKEEMFPKIRALDSHLLKMQRPALWQWWDSYWDKKLGKEKGIE